MMLLITGTEIHPFDRLIEEIDRLAQSGRLFEPMFAQLGHTRHEPKPFSASSASGRCAGGSSRRASSSRTPARNRRCSVSSAASARSSCRGRSATKSTSTTTRSSSRSACTRSILVRRVVEMGDLGPAIEEERSRSAAKKKEWRPAELVAYLDGLLADWNL
jgi:hypothetical protein